MGSLTTAQLCIIAIGLVAATFNGGMGYGYSSITVPVALLFYKSRQLNPALVLIEIAVNFSSLIANRAAVPRVWKRVVPMLVGVVPGVVVGSLVLASVEAAPLKLVTFGCLLPLLLLQSVGRRWPVKNERRWGTVLGAGVGVLYGATTISGPPLALLFNNQGLPKDDFRAALAIVRLTESTCTALAYLALGLFSADTLSLGALLVPGVIVGLPVGFVLVRPMATETFRRVCMAADALLVTFALMRTLNDLHLAQLAQCWPLIVLVAVFEAWALSRFFAREAAASRAAP